MLAKAAIEGKEIFTLNEAADSQKELRRYDYVLAAFMDV